MEINALKFFAEQGISRSESQHLSNVATKQAQFLERKLNSLNYVKSELLTEEGKLLSLKTVHEMNNEEITKDLKRIGYLYGFVAWCREAVTAEEKYITALHHKVPEHHLSEEELATFNALLKEFDVLNSKGAKKAVITDTHVTDDYTVAQISDYLLNEAIASSIGKYIHNDGQFQKILKELQTLAPTTFLTKGNKDYLVLNTSAVSATSFSNFVVDLQSLHREHEKEVNRYKAQLKDELTSRQMKADNDYIKASREWSDAYAKKSNEIANWKNLIALRSEEKVKAFRKLKIVVPNKFNDLVNELKK